MKKFQFYLLSFLFISTLHSCEEDTEEPAPDPPSTNTVLVGNEGAITGGTGNLSAYRPADKSVEHNLYQKANTTPMGNLLHSIFVDGNRTFLVLSGAGEILVVESDSYKLIRRIGGFGSPRQIIKVDDTKYYISDKLEAGIKIYDYERNKILETLPTGQGPEAMLKYKDFVFVANQGQTGTIANTVSIIHAVEDTVMRELTVGDNPNSMQIDSSKALWVLSSGYADQNTTLNTPGTLISYDLDIDSLMYNIDTLAVQDSLVFVDPLEKPNKLTINSDSTRFYFLDQFSNANVKRYTIGNMVLPANTFIEGSFYGMAFDRVNAELYLTDPKDFEMPGEVIRFDENGVETDRFSGGLKPLSFGFK